jgi:hypothetical protein
MNEEMNEEQRFDELARTLAGGAISRGRVLRLLGGLLAATVLASWPGTAWATKARAGGAIVQAPEGDGGGGDYKCSLDCLGEWIRCWDAARNEFDRCWCRNNRRACQWLCTGVDVTLEYCVAPDPFA